MKNKTYIAFARGLIIFFGISHVLSYFISTLQTAWIIKEIRKAQQKGEKAAKKAGKKNDPN